PPSSAVSGAPKNGRRARTASEAAASATRPVTRLIRTRIPSQRKSWLDGETRGRMREQSHIDAMREAVRGDIERAKKRRESIFERGATPAFEIRADPPSNKLLQSPEPAPEPEPEPEVQPEPEPEVEPVAAEAPAPKRSRWAFWRRD